MNTGTGILARMQELSDHPITPSKYEHYDINGVPYAPGGITVEKCWGTKGLYIASNITGSWEITGPFGQSQ